LPKVPNTGRDSARIAPSFLPKGNACEVNPDVRIYTAETLAEFLKWKPFKVENVLNALSVSREPGAQQEEHPKVLFYF